MQAWGVTPRQSVERECARRGVGAVVAGCVDILAGRDIDVPLVRVLAGPAAEPVIRGQAGGLGGYWPRVWSLRGLLYAWEDPGEPTYPGAAVDAIVAAISDPAWRVREMAAKVIARHAIDPGLDAVVLLRDDPVPRVRRAAERAVVDLTSGAPGR